MDKYDRCKENDDGPYKRSWRSWVKHSYLDANVDGVDDENM